MGLDEALQLGLGLFALGRIERDADRSAVRHDRLGELDQAPCAGDDDVVRLALGRTRRARERRERAALLREQGAAQHALAFHHRRAVRLDGARIGEVAVDDLQVRAAPPDRHRHEIQSADEMPVRRFFARKLCFKARAFFGEDAALLFDPCPLRAGGACRLLRRRCRFVEAPPQPHGSRDRRGSHQNCQRPSDNVAGHVRGSTCPYV